MRGPDRAQLVGEVAQSLLQLRDPLLETEDPGDPGQVIDEKQAVLFSAGDRFWVRAVGQDLRFIFLSAPPLREPIAWGGPIVMNTKAELDLAFRELDNGTFLKQG